MSIKEKTITHLKILAKSWILYFLLIVAGLIIGTNLYLKSQIQIEVPEVNLGEKVVVVLDNGKEMQTYENLLVKEKEKIYYKNEYITIDVTDGIVVYQDWK